MGRLGLFNEIEITTAKPALSRLVSLVLACDTRPPLPPPPPPCMRILFLLFLVSTMSVLRKHISSTVVSSYPTDVCILSSSVIL